MLSVITMFTGVLLPLVGRSQGWRTPSDAQESCSVKTCPNANRVLIDSHPWAIMEITSSETVKEGRKDGRKEGREGKEHRVMKHYKGQKTDNTSQWWGTTLHVLLSSSYLNCPPGEVFKKNNGSRSLLFLSSKGLLLGLWDLILFAICSSLEEVRENRKAQDRYCSVFNDDRQRWESTDQLFPLGRAWAIRKREFSVWFAHSLFLIEALVPNC